MTTERNEQIAPLISRVVLLVEQYLKLSQDENFYRIRDATQIDDPGQMIDRLADQIYFKVEDKQSLLETYSVCERALRIIEMLNVKIDTLNAKH